MEKKRKLDSKSSQFPQQIKEEITESSQFPQQIKEEEQIVSSEEEPIQSVISTFSKESLTKLLSDVAALHPDVAATVRATAESDPSQRKIFVYGLHPCKIIIDEFRKYGEIEDCSITETGHMFVQFKTRRGARLALKEPRKVIRNQFVSCQMEPQQPDPIPNPRFKKIYVSNVGSDFDPVELHRFFSKYGDIEEGPSGLDRETGKPTGSCVFVYRSILGARTALMDPLKLYRGVFLNCQQIDEHPYQSLSRALAPAGPPKNVDPAALGQAVMAVMAAQGAGLNLRGRDAARFW